MLEQQPAVISFSDVTQRFGDNVALSSITVDFLQGEFATIVGPSGCGKSTLLRLIAGLIIASDGQVRVDGREVIEPRSDVGFMFQRPTLLPWLSAVENVLLPITLHRRPTASDRREAESLLATVGLAGSEARYPDHLSGGMQQRVALARLLMTGARILLLDEPFGAVDEFTREKLNFELLRIQRDTGATILLVTHSITEAVLMGDRVITMTPHPGRIGRVVDVDLGPNRDRSVLRSAAYLDAVNDVRDTFDTDRSAA
ncbi:ABC transporter ATP-binding protein [Microbacterium sp. ET2]|uniref:ABC transporter ATP-binding protein n=1 Tax=Microbacterium albipurpureum TaxID=3050384 RepID=UPI00259D13B9|nr:ABC transporter ATP-binding protein [Microbacterium sp. ET2 (Ac-2212)]WJL94908.1 ABC transporter ATP-binding protein [Microbacterium sp. ET2 (Ac-2212)]